MGIMAAELDCPITESMRQELVELRRATGVGPYKLLAWANNVPHELTASKIHSWLAGQTMTARHDHVAFVLDAYRALPQNHTVEISRHQRRELQQLRAQSGIGPTALLRGQRDAIPDGLTAEQVRRWLSGEVQQVRRDHLDWVRRRWRKLAHGRHRRVAIRQKDVDALNQAYARTGVSADALLRAAEDPPDNLTGGMIAKWMTGLTKTAREDHLDFVLHLWRALPDAHPGDVRARQCADAVRLDDALRRHLKARKRETGLGPQALLKWAEANGEPIPDDLTVAKANNWLSGRARYARRHHLDWVHAIYNKAGRPVGERVTLTPEHRSALEAERARTGVSQAALLARAADVPEELSAPLISSWINGYAKTARADLYAYVLAQWRKLPDG